MMANLVFALIITFWFEFTNVYLTKRKFEEYEEVTHYVV